MGLVLITAPTQEPLDLNEVKRHLRIDGNEQDDYVVALIAAARAAIEGDGDLGTGRQLLTATWEQTFDGFLSVREVRHSRIYTRRILDLEIRKPPLATVTSVKYIDADGAEQTVSAPTYVVDTNQVPGKVRLAYGQSWPATRYEEDAVRVRFTAGYGTAAQVPADLKHAMKILIGHLYEHREITITGTIIAEIPKSYDCLVEAYRMRRAA